MSWKKSSETIILLLLLVGLFFGCWQIIANYFKQQIISQQEEYLSKKVQLLSQHLDLDHLNSKEDHELLESFINDSSERLTLLDPEGKILFDTSNPSLKGTRYSRPEIQTVMNGSRQGSSLRVSDTLHKELLYVALPLKQKEKLVGVLRIAEATSNFLPRTDSFRRWIFGIFLFVFFFMFCVIYYLVRQKNQPIRTILPVLKKMVANPQRTEVIMQTSDQWEELYQTINALSEQTSETYRAYTTTEEQFFTLLNELMIGIFLIDYEEHLLLLNPKMQLHLGVDHFVPGQNYTEVIQEPKVIQLIHQVTPEAPIQQQEITFSNQQTLDLSLRYFKQPDETGQIMGIAYDLTKVRQLEKLQKDFVGNVSHELKTPVTSLMGFTETLLDGAKDDPETLTAFLKIMQKDAARLNDLILEIIQLSRNGETSYELRTLSLEVLFQQIIQSYQPAIDEKHLDIQLSGTPNSTFTIQLELLYPIIKNLVENAIQYSKENSKIIIRYFAGETLQFSVQDFGMGIDQEDQERIFERFYRVDKARSRHSGGTGLGLAIVKEYVTRLGGTIQVTSHPQVGSTFEVTLPKQEPAS
ncbi:MULTISPECIES: ATP-binding protein [unclassified Enterococcus]|jgi:two-component system phosphate regulon sensor histidine kinase PhoR|uniref:sensor histidine kinase n=1 Tax=unclassified Enterococcus TaxID=2608891 RepID=UPI003D2C926C